MYNEKIPFTLDPSFIKDIKCGKIICNLSGLIYLIKFGKLFIHAIFTSHSTSFNKVV